MQRAKPDQDQARHVVGTVPQKRDRQGEHEHGADEPVLHEGEAQHLLVPEHVAHFLVTHLRQRRIHHEDQADGDGNGSGAHTQIRDGVRDARREVANGHPDEHGEKNPERQEAVEKRKLFSRSRARFEQSVCSHEYQSESV